MLFSSIYTLIFDIGIKTALHTTINTCSYIINNLTNYSTNYPNIKKWLDETDIKWTIEIIERFIHDLSINNENKEEIKEEKQLLVIDKCLEGLKEILIKLEKELKEIENGIKYHETKYLYSWRNIYIDEYIEKANNHIKILNNRFELFIKIINSRDVKK
jgi:hypothetical protein